MATKIGDVFPEPEKERWASVQTFFDRYPLTDWFDGGVWELDLEKDITEPLPTIRSAFRYWAWQLDYGPVRTKVIVKSGRRYLLVQASQHPEDHPMNPEKIARRQKRVAT